MAIKQWRNGFKIKLCFLVGGVSREKDSDFSQNGPPLWEF